MKMTESDLLRVLDAEKDDARLQTEEIHRTKAIRAYLRKPYGTEQAGRSQVVSSDVFDAVEGMLPELVEVFVSSDKAVVFDPVGPEDEEGAKQATEAVNHVFYKQNNGFLTLYTAAKDALLLRTGGVKWWWESKRSPEWTTYRDVDEMQLAVFVATNPEAEIVEKDESDPQPDGIQRFTVRVKTIKERGVVRICAVPPDEVEISRRHNSTLLTDCPYVAHVREVTLSDVRDMGYKVTVDDVKSATRETHEDDWREETRHWDLQRAENSEDEAATKGWLREEYILVDFDGDGITERRKVVRLGNKVLENVETSHVPMAIWTPYPIPHRADGLSVHDLVEDFQRSRTEIWRNQLDNLDLANNQETVVLTDSNGNPLADIDDLLNRRPGGILRERQAGAIRPYVERWQGIEAMPMLEALEVMKENRTGYTRYSQGLDSESLNNTATGITKIMNASQKRMKLMARIMGESLVAPVMRGIFKTLTDYCMEKLSFRLNGRFAQYDPQEWRDGYDMTINVGIGNGDTMQQQQFLMGLMQSQFALMQTPMGGMVQPKNVYATQARLIESAGFRNPAEFLTSPEEMPPQQPPPPDTKMQIEQMRLQADAQKFQAEQQNDVQKWQAELQKQTQIDQNRQEYEARQKQMELEQMAQLEQIKAQFAERARMEQMAFDKWKAELDAQVKLTLGAKVEAPKDDGRDQVLIQIMQQIAAEMSAPKEVVRDNAGQIVGVQRAQLNS